jgi:hypothetical protein
MELWGDAGMDLFVLTIHKNDLGIRTTLEPASGKRGFSNWGIFKIHLGIYIFTRNF